MRAGDFTDTVARGFTSVSSMGSNSAVRCCLVLRSLRTAVRFICHRKYKGVCIIVYFCKHGMYLWKREVLEICGRDRLGVHRIRKLKRKKPCTVKKN